MGRAGFALLLLVLCGLAACTVEDPPPVEPAEVSANFDLEDVEPFLLRLTTLMPGSFRERYARQLAAWIAEQPVDSEKRYVYGVVFDGKKTDLEVVAFMDDIDAPDLCFCTHPELARRIDRLIDDYFEEAGK